MVWLKLQRQPVNVLTEKIILKICKPFTEVNNTNNIFFCSAVKLTKKESLSIKLSQRPGRQELIDRNILFQVVGFS